MINRVRVRRDFIRFDLTFECFYLSVQMRNSNLNGNTSILAEIKYRDLVLSRLNGFFTSSYIASKHSNFRCRSRSFNTHNSFTRSSYTLQLFVSISFVQEVNVSKRWCGKWTHTLSFCYIMQCIINLW